MEIITVNPRGFCKGVVKAIMIAKETAKQYPNEKITIQIGRASCRERVYPRV